MKKLILMLAFVTQVTLGQDFELTGLPNSGSINTSEVFMFSTTAGNLYKFTYGNLQGNLDDETWTWTAAHIWGGTSAFNGIVTFNDPVNVNSVLSLKSGGEIWLGTTPSSIFGGSLFYIDETRDLLAYTYAGSSAIDTVMSWNQMFLLGNTFYGDNGFRGTTDMFNDLSLSSGADFYLGSGSDIITLGMLDMSSSTKFILPTIGGDPTFRNFGTAGSDGSAFVVFNYGTASGDTLLTWRKLLLEDNSTYGSWEFNGIVSYPPENVQTAPIAAWDVSGLQQVVVVGVQTSVTVTSITNGVDGQILVIVNGQEQGDYVTIQDNSTINLRGSRDFVFNAQWQSLTLVYTLIAGVGEWSEVSRSHNTTEDLYDVDIERDLVVGDDLQVVDNFDVDGTATFNQERIDDPPSALQLSEGSQTVAVTNTYMPLIGSDGAQAVITDFTGLTTTGTRLTIHSVQEFGFIIQDNTNISCEAGADMFLDVGDIAEFILGADGDWRSTAPLSDDISPQDVDVPVVFTTYEQSPSFGQESNIHGGLQEVVTAGELDFETSPTIILSIGTGRILLVAIAGSDVSGTFTISGTKVNRETGATSSSSEIITVTTLSDDFGDTDANGNPRIYLENAYVSSDWWTGTCTLSTGNIILTDVDVYNIAYEQMNDVATFDIETFDASVYTTNVNADFDAYLYTVEVTSGDMVDITPIADLHVTTAIANRYWRLRRGNIGITLDGTTEGFFLNVFYANSPSYVENANIKVWVVGKSDINEY